MPRRLAVCSHERQRRGRVENIEHRASSVIVHSRVPLAGMFGYATALRSLTKGRASYSMEPSHYAVVPDDVARTLLD